MPQTLEEHLVFWGLLILVVAGILFIWYRGEQR